MHSIKENRSWKKKEMIRESSLPYIVCIRLLVYLVLFKERPTDVAVEGISEVGLQIAKSDLQVVRLIGVVNGQNEKINKPGEIVSQSRERI